MRESSPRLSSNGGLYVHVPFCRVRCPFCSFAVTVDQRGMQGWLEALEREIALRRTSFDLPFDTVYLGGGTPSLLPPAMVERLLDLLRSNFRISGGAEVTLEANPGTLDFEGFRRLLGAGVNRLSLGIQSFDGRELEFLGRDHSVSDSLESFRNARRAGFANISADLIYGLPGRSLDDLRKGLGRLRELGPEHVSAYRLTFEPSTPLGRRKARGEFPEPESAEELELFLAVRDGLGEAGYFQYEVSSFARSIELQSRHNRKYWENAPYLGLGPSAHSYRDGVRSWNVARPDAYARMLASGEDPLAGNETLREEERRLERIFLNLRTASGLSWSGFKEEFGSDLRVTHAPLLEKLTREKLLAPSDESLRLTPRGLALADTISLELAS
jgi:oxygen-independent coproporphyrinogen-3 oxidase